MLRRRAFRSLSNHFRRHLSWRLGPLAQRLAAPASASECPATTPLHCQLPGLLRWWVGARWKVLRQWSDSRSDLSCDLAWGPTPRPYWPCCRDLPARYPCREKALHSFQIGIVVRSFHFLPMLALRSSDNRLSKWRFLATVDGSGIIRVDTLVANTGNSSREREVALLTNWLWCCG